MNTELANAMAVKAPDQNNIQLSGVAVPISPVQKYLVHYEIGSGALSHYAFRMEVNPGSFNSLVADIHVDAKKINEGFLFLVPGLRVQVWGTLLNSFNGLNKIFNVEAETIVFYKEGKLVARFEDCCVR